MRRFFREWRTPCGSGVPTARGAGRRRAGLRTSPAGNHRPARAVEPAHAPRRWHLVYNGEIYNYRELRDELRGRGHLFHTAGDTEVLLHAWARVGRGRARPPERHVRVRRLGRARAAPDARARDPFGEKPALLRRTAAGARLRAPRSGRSFATRTCRGAGRGGARALPRPRRVPADRDPHLLRRHRAPPGRPCPRWPDGRIESSATGGPPGRGAGDLRRRGRAAARAAVDSVRLRLRSDVPVGTSLSGGLDSSAIVALGGAARRRAPPARVHGAFPGFAHDERAYAQAVARAAGVSSTHVVEPTRRELLADLDASSATTRSRSAPAASTRSGA